MYRLDQSADVSAAFRSIVAGVRGLGRLDIFVPAARWIVEELARTPNEFGESRDWFADAGTQARCGFAGPLYVAFGVHEESQVVFLRRFVLCRSRL